MKVNKEGPIVHYVSYQFYFFMTTQQNKLNLWHSNKLFSEIPVLQTELS